MPKHLPDTTNSPSLHAGESNLPKSKHLAVPTKCSFPNTHAENVLVRRVGSGLGMRYPLMGDGERSLVLRFSGK